MQLHILFHLIYSIVVYTLAHLIKKYPFKCTFIFLRCERNKIRTLEVYC